MDRKTLEIGSDGAPEGGYSVGALGAVLRGLLTRFLRVLFVRLGAVLGHSFALLMDAFTAHFAVAGDVARSLLSASQQLVQKSHACSLLGRLVRRV